METTDNVFRFFACQFSKRLEGVNLVDYVREKGVVGGVYGQDWWFVDKQGLKLGDDLEELRRASVICLALDTTKQLWVPPSIAPVRLTKRENIDTLLQPIPEDQPDTNFRVTEAKMVKIIIETCG